MIGYWYDNVFCPSVHPSVRLWRVTHLCQKTIVLKLNTLDDNDIERRKQQKLA